MKDISRRDFLKVAAVGTAGITGQMMLGTLASAEAVKPIYNEPEAWTHETDVVVVGTGTSMYGAIKAAHDGLDVIAIDAFAIPGGTAGFSGATLWLPNNPIAREMGDTREKAEAYIRHGLYGANTTDEEINAFLDNIDPMLEFIDPLMMESSYNLGYVSAVSYGDYHPSWENGMVRGRSIGWTTGKQAGNAIAETWRLAEVEVAEKHGVKFMTSTKATKFVYRIQENGVPEVLGIIAMQGTNEISIKAKKGVLMACGGYEWDPELQRAFLVNPDRYPFSLSTNDGTGLRMCMGLGAALTNMTAQFGNIAYKERAQEQYEKKSLCHIAMDRRKPHAIMVNRNGHRFMNEAVDYHTAGQQFTTTDSHLDNEHVNLPFWTVFDQQFIDKGLHYSYMLGVDLDERGTYPFMKCADTLEELAQIMGVPADNFVAEVKKYNQFVDDGFDADFFRGESPYDCDLAVDTVTPEDKKNTLGKIEKAPFYAAEMAISTLGSCGGPRINEHAQIMHITGEPIGRLYGCGNMTGYGGPGKQYGGAGGTLGPGFVMGFVAANHIINNQKENWV